MVVFEALNRATRTLRDHAIESPRLNAELLLAYSLNLSKEGLYVHLQDPLGKEEERVLEELMERRVSGSPFNISWDIRSSGRST